MHVGQAGTLLPPSLHVGTNPQFAADSISHAVIPATDVGGHVTTTDIAQIDGCDEYAVRAFDNLLELYPDSDKAAAGNLKKALAYQEQNQIGQAIVQFRYVVATYEGSDEARLARDKLSSLGASF